MTKMQVFSSGGGTQSSAIIALILQNKLPKPDVVIMADTGREKQATWDYMHQVTGPALAGIGVEVHIARAADYATVDLYSSKGSVLMPMWTNQSGKVGRLPTYCSNEWKRRVVQRYLRRNLQVKECDLWLGISSDEVERVRTSQEQWMEHVFPLVGIVNFDSHPKLFMSRSDCYAAVREMGWPDPPKSSCWMCFSGDTEVVTRDGIRKIKNLAGTTPDLLVPKKGKLGGLSEVGKFVPAPVQSFGVQQLYKIVLKRSNFTKEIYATAEHRWLLAPESQWADVETRWRTTLDLHPGESLANLNAVSMTAEEPLVLAIMQGFTFGDGNRGQDNRPATINFQEGNWQGKSKAILPLFEMLKPRERINSKNNREWIIYGLPRTWKDFPDIRESRSFLLGWLAGWFAADGTVSTRGRATLYSATREHLEFARSVCAVLGVRTSGIRSKTRKGKGKEPTPIFGMDISPLNLPLSFFLLEHHKERVEAREGLNRYTHWVVESVEATDRVEEVFCATVEGVGAFGLADGLMTGNCPHMGNAQWKQQKELAPEEFERAVQLEKEIQQLDPNAFLHLSGKPLDQVDFYAQGSLFEDEQVTCTSTACWL